MRWPFTPSLSDSLRFGSRERKECAASCSVLLFASFRPSSTTPLDSLPPRSPSTDHPPPVISTIRRIPSLSSRPCAAIGRSPRSSLSTSRQPIPWVGRVPLLKPEATLSSRLTESTARRKNKRERKGNDRESEREIERRGRDHSRRARSRLLDDTPTHRRDFDGATSKETETNNFHRFILPLQFQIPSIAFLSQTLRYIPQPPLSARPALRYSTLRYSTLSASPPETFQHHQPSFIN
ncbi:hypothetical protein LZ30DRAFT_431327 [Colletotrichum cereale]|nr:hypothetical protein LZ30DRAFT_431327 [Colletotrichum cereale]